MKIIEKKEEEEKEIKKTCYNCKTKFSYISSDIKRDRDGKYVICPSCNKFNAIEI